MAIFADNFTDTDGTLLAAHAPDTGDSWTLLWGTSGTNAEINTNRVRSDGDLNSGVMYTANCAYPSADYDITCTLVSVVGNNDRPIYLLARIQDQENMYGVRIENTASESSLYKKVSGTWTAIGSLFTRPLDGSVIKLEIIGTALKFYDDGVEIASATVSDISGIGKAGIAFGGGTELVTSGDDGSTSNVIKTLSVNNLGTSGVVVSIDHETGNLNQYTTTVTDSGDLSVAAGAALAGTGNGLSVLIDDATAIYGQVIVSPASLRYRFYVDPNSLTMASNDQFDIFQIVQNGGSFIQASFIRLKFVSGTGYQLIGNAQNDAGISVMADTCNITDAPHYVEVYLTKAASAVSSDGTCQWWVDDVDQGTVTGIDNFNILSDWNMRVRMGAAAGIDAGTSGTLYLDELVINNTGNYIGPVASGGTAVPVFVHQLQQQGIG